MQKILSLSVKEALKHKHKCVKMKRVNILRISTLGLTEGLIFFSYFFFFFEFVNFIEQKNKLQIYI